MSGAGALWGRETMGGMGHDTLFGGGNGLDTEVGYGLPTGARFVGTPRVGLRTSEYGRDYRLCVERAPSSRLRSHRTISPPIRTQ